MPLDLFDDSVADQEIEESEVTKVIAESKKIYTHENKQFPFENLGLSFELAQVLAGHNIFRPTPIEELALPLLTRSSLIISPTGSGKTLTFLLPAIESLILNPQPFHILILAPTRELATEIYDQFSIFSQPFGLEPVLITGGQGLVFSSQELVCEPSCVIATPGRLAAVLRSQDQSLLSLFNSVKYLVLDEADMFLESDFDDEMNYILENTNKTKITFLATASQTESIMEVASSLNFEILLSPEQQIPQNIEHFYEIVPQNFEASSYAAYYISALTGIDVINKNDGKPMNYTIRNTQVRQGIVFAEGAEQCEVLVRTFNQLQFKSVALHGKMKQDDRIESLKEFRLGNALLLIATDLAARGLDIQSVDFVVQMGVCTPFQYLHRAGRAGRSGSAALSYMLIKPQQLLLKQAIEQENHITMVQYREFRNYCWNGNLEVFNEEYFLREVFKRVGKCEVQAKMDTQMENVGDRLRKGQERREQISKTER